MKGIFISKAIDFVHPMTKIALEFKQIFVFLRSATILIAFVESLSFSPHDQPARGLRRELETLCDLDKVLFLVLPAGVP